MYICTTVYMYNYICMHVCTTIYMYNYIYVYIASFAARLEADTSGRRGDLDSLP